MPKAGLITKQMKELGLAVPLMGGDGIFTNELRTHRRFGLGGRFRLDGRSSAEQTATGARIFSRAMPSAGPARMLQPYDPLTYEATMIC